MTIQHESTGAAARRAADALGFAAAPTFAAMAVLTAGFESGQSDMLCAAAFHGSPLSGMVAMYALMSAFHLAPWLKLISSRQRHHATTP